VWKLDGWLRGFDCVMVVRCGVVMRGRWEFDIWIWNEKVQREETVVMLLELRLPVFLTGTCWHSDIVVVSRRQLTKLYIIAQLAKHT